MICDDLQALHKANECKLLAEFNQSTQKAADATVECRHDGNRATEMHHKFVLVDGEVLFNGSFNFTEQARIRNRENMLGISEKPILEAFGKEFDMLWLAYEGNEL